MQEKKRRGTEQVKIILFYYDEPNAPFLLLNTYQKPINLLNLIITF